MHGDSAVMSADWACLSMPGAAVILLSDTPGQVSVRHTPASCLSLERRKQTAWVVGKGRS